MLEATGFHVVGGGCVTYRFDLRDATAAASAVSLSAALGFVDRATIARLLDDYSDGRLHLDPTSQGATG
jgi:hypothetical protein